MQAYLEASKYFTLTYLAYFSTLPANSLDWFTSIIMQHVNLNDQMINPWNDESMKSRSAWEEQSEIVGEIVKMISMHRH